MRFKFYVTVLAVLVLIFSSTNQLFAQEIKASALKQIQSLINEKESRTPAQKKINSQLWYALKMNRGQAISTDVATLDVSITKDAGGLALVDIKGIVDNALIKTINILGGKILFSSQSFNIIHAAIPLQALEPIASLPEVRSIDMAVPPSHADTKKDKIITYTGETPYLRNNISAIQRFSPGFEKRAEMVRQKVVKALSREEFKPFFIGSATSNGDFKHNAALARTNFGVNGAGIKIGILSDSYDAAPTGTNASDDIVSGDLPGVGNPNGFTTPVTVLSEGSGSDEGRAMLQIVHDLAPGAQLFFASAFNGEADFAQQILNLRTAGCDIICDDVFYYDEPVFQDGLVAQSVNSVTASGAIYFSSAGNQGNKNDNTSSVWEGDFVDGGTSVAPLPLTGSIHNFGAATFNQLISSTNRLALFWSDPQGGSGNDYDLYVLNNAMTSVVSSSTNVQTGTQDAFEFITTNNAANTRIVIFQKTGAAVRALHLNGFGGRLTISTSGQTHGHSSAAAAYSVAAVQASGITPFTSANVVETFSSDGLRRKFYNPNGTPITPGNLLFTTAGGVLLQKPDIAAADGVSTTLPLNGGLNPFFGTSAAAPHAAAITGLLKQRNPMLTPAEIRTALTTTAIDIETAGTDRDAGFGIVMAQAALNAVPAVPGVTSVSATLTVEGCTPGNGVIDPGENVTVNVCIKNFGTVATTNLIGTLLTTGGITGPGAPQNYGVVAAGATLCKSFTFSNSGTCGGSITASIQFQDGALNLGTLTYPFTLGIPATTFTQNFDAVAAPALPASWTTTATGGGAAWVTSTTNSSSVPNNAFTTDAASTSTATLVSPVIAITNSTAKINFKNLFNTEGSFDGELLEIKIGAGAFQDIIAAGGSFVSGGYNSSLDNSTAFPNRSAWSGLSGGTAATPAYINSIINLPASAAGQNVQFRWIVTSDVNTVATGSAGVRIDDIAITDGGTCCSNSAPGPTVTINQAALQADPTSASPINFTVVFSEAVTGFDGSDISFTGSTTGGTLTAVVTGAGPTYNVAVSGMTGNGIVVASVPANAAINAGTIGNNASTSTDNSVAFGTPPSVTINQGATQTDPATTAPIVFDVTFSQPVTGFTASDISFTGSTASGTLSAVVSGSSATYTVSVSGMTGSGLVVASIPANSATSAIGFGNTASTSTDNSVQFNPPPCTITCPANMTVNTSPNQCGANVTLPATGTVGTCGTITYSPASGSFFPKGTTTVNVTSSTGPTCSFTVTVVDAQAPSITCPPTVTVGCASAVPAVNIAAVTATDNCPGVVVTHVGDVISAQTCANKFTVTRTYRATDAARLTSTCSQTIIVNDVTGPVIAAIADITTPTAIGSCTATVTFVPTATDGCGGVVTITSVPASGSAFGIGTTPVTITATDACGNASTKTFNVIVTDAQPATITTQPSNQTVCAGNSATFSVTATNAVSYRWQQFLAGAWTDVAGATGFSLTVSSVTLNMNTSTYRVIVNGLCSSVTSTARTLFVNPLPSINLSTTQSSILPPQTTSITATVNPTGGSFVWFRNGVVVPGVTGASIGNITVDNAGTYRAVYTDPNGCVSTSADLIISAQASDRLYIAPNPNFGQFWVRFYNQQSEQLTLEVFNSNGARVYQKAVTTTLAYTRIDVDLRLNAPGVYVVQLRNSTGKLLASKNMIVSHR